MQTAEVIERAEHQRLRLIDMMSILADDPAFFMEEVCHREPTSQQREVFDAIKAGEKRISMRSGHGIGKTTLFAALLLWFVTTRYSCLAVATAAKEDQLVSQIWPEAHAMHSAMPGSFKDKIRIETTSIFRPANQHGARAIARVARRENPEALQGFHHDHLLLLVDEASGVADPIYGPIEGMTTKEDNIVILGGNPTKKSGYFHRTYTSDRKNWKCFKFSSLDSPLVAESYARDIAERFGKDSNIYRVRVLGEPPKEDDDVLITLEPVERAMREWSSGFVTDGKEIRIGVDPARSTKGDASALVARCDDIVLEVEEHWIPDEMKIVGKALDFKRRVMEKNPKARFAGFYVDTIGLGAGVHDRLHEQGEKSFDVNVSKDARRWKVKGEPMPNKLRDELWLHLRAWLRDENGKIPDNEKLASEIMGPKFSSNSSGRLVVEAKDAMKKRGLSSPNMADALCLTFFKPHEVWSSNSEGGEE